MSDIFVTTLQTKTEPVIVDGKGVFVKKVLLWVIVGLALFGLPFIAYTSEEFRGAKKCKVCHIKIYKTWQKTPHATAFDVLNPGVKAEEKKKAGLDPQSLT